MRNFKTLIMKTKNLLWVALIGLAASCTVSKRIDKWGYRVSFDKKQTEAVAIEEATAETSNKEAISVKTNSTALVNQDINQIIPINETKVIDVETPLESKVFEKNLKTNKESKVPGSRLNHKAEKMMAKLNSNLAQSGNSSRPDTAVLVLLAIFIPPLAVYLYEGSWTERCTINLILTILCGIPGMIHALLVVLK